jgi:hypothetical protein
VLAGEFGIHDAFVECAAFGVILCLNAHKMGADDSQTRCKPTAQPPENPPRINYACPRSLKTSHEGSSLSQLKS